MPAQDQANQVAPLTDGPAAAAFVASGIGCLTLGLLITLAEASSAIKNLMNWWDPVGPLGGKSTLAVAVWLVCWIVLHQAWKNRDIRFGRAYAATLVLVALGFLGTFPPIFQVFAAK